MTNTVGVLVFVLLFVTLAAADATVLVRTPLHQQTSLTGRIFEVRGDTVYFLDTEAGTTAFARMVRQLPEINWYNAGTIQHRINNFSASTSNYRVDFIGSVLYGWSLRYRVRSDVSGDVMRQLRDSTSQYHSILEGLDADEHYIAFLVRPDGFEAFREARKLAWARGLKVGWEPVEASRELTFGSGGRTIGTQ